MEGVEKVGIFAVITDIVPGDGENAVFGIEVIVDQVRSGRSTVAGRRRHSAPGIDIGEERRDHRLIHAAVDGERRVFGHRVAERHIAVGVDVEAGEGGAEEIQPA